jgi:hypothetical protein
MLKVVFGIPAIDLLVTGICNDNFATVEII